MTSRSVDVDGGYCTPFAPGNSGRRTSSLLTHHAAREFAQTVAEAENS